MSIKEFIIPKVKRDYIISLLEKGERIDGRKLDEYRGLEIKVGVIDNADGSAQVKLGDTFIVVGIKSSIGDPYPDEPNKGVFIVNAEFPPVASPTFEPGPPDENAIELARVVDRGIRESNFIDLEKLVIVPGSKVRLIWIDIYVLNHDGNLIDASSYAAVAALLNTRLRKIVVGEDGRIEELEEREPLPLRGIPIHITHAKVNNKIIVDPMFDEEAIMDARLTMAVTEDGMICAVQKGGVGSFTVDEVKTIMENALKLAPIIRGRILEAVKGGQV